MEVLQLFLLFVPCMREQTTRLRRLDPHRFMWSSIL